NSLLAPVTGPTNAGPLAVLLPPLGRRRFWLAVAQAGAGIRICRRQSRRWFLVFRDVSPTGGRPGLRGSFHGRFQLRHRNLVWDNGKALGSHATSDYVCRIP